ncbi:hypothetical protein [Methylotetracoccus oryzae]|uniref:hypothetical protein n=1 Tax=Methylotetracoccus oryzae TaxID=1919059 RepID=UPI001117B01E|nr:hypothetical protein [Methylotetracoccus oryzae]
MDAKLLVLRASMGLGLAACAQTAYQITAAPAARDLSSETRDVMECDRESHINPLARTLLCGVGAAICRDVVDSRYRKCMGDRGYRLKPIG